MQSMKATTCRKDGKIVKYTVFADREWENVGHEKENPKMVTKERESYNNLAFGLVQCYDVRCYMFTDDWRLEMKQEQKLLTSQL